MLNDIHIDIMDYISPASCTDVQFRSMWAEFEWENKVNHANLECSKMAFSSRLSGSRRDLPGRFKMRYKHVFHVA